MADKKVTASLELDVSSIEQGSKKARDSIKSVGDEFDKLGEKGSQGTKKASDGVSDLLKGFESMSKVGSTLTKTLTLPLLGFGALATKEASEFNYSMAEVQAISGATSEELKIMENQARELGKTTMASAKDASQGLKYYAMAGYSVKESMDALEPTLRLSIASNTDLGKTADICSDAMQGLGLKAEETARFTDILAQASSKSNTNVEMMGESFKYSASICGQLGVEAEDLAIALGLMANAGIKGSMSGTQIRTALSRLVKPTKEMSQVMDKYNISLQKNSDGTVNLMDTMTHLRSSLKDLDATERANVLTTLMGQEALSGWSAIIGATDEQFNSLTKAIYDSEGATQRMSDTMQNTFHGSLKEMQSAFGELKIAVGNILIPVLEGVVKKITDAFNWFNSLDEGMQGIIVTAGGVVAGIGPVLLILGQLGRVITSTSKGLSGLLKVFGLTSSGAVLLKAGVVVAITALTLLADKIGSSNEMLGSLQKNFGFVGEMIGTTCEMIHGAISLTFGNATTLISGVAKAIVALLKGNFAEAGSIIKDTMAEVSTNTTKAMTDFSGMTSFAIDKIREMDGMTVDNFKNNYQSTMESLKTVTESNMGDVASTLSEKFQGIDQQTITTFKGTSDTMAMLLNGITENMSKSQMAEVFEKNMEKMQRAGELSADALEKDMSTALKTIEDNMSSGATSIGEAGKSIFENLKDASSRGMSETTALIAEDIKGMNQTTFNELKSLGGTWEKAFLNIGDITNMSTEDIKSYLTSNLRSMNMTSGELMTALESEMKTHLQNMNLNADSALSKLPPEVREAVQGMITEGKGASEVKTYLTSALQGTDIDVGAVLSGLGIAVDRETSSAAQKASQGGQKIVNSVDSSTKGVGQKVENNMKGASTGVEKATNNLAKSADTNFSKLKKSADTNSKGASDTLKTNATNMYNGAKTSFSKTAESGTSSTKTLKDNVINNTAIMKNSAIRFWEDIRDSYSKSISGEINITRNITEKVKQIVTVVEEAEKAEKALNMSAMLTKDTINLTEKDSALRSLSYIKSADIIESKDKEAKDVAPVVNETKNITYNYSYTSPKESSIYELRRKDRIQAQRLALSK